VIRCMNMPCKTACSLKSHDTPPRPDFFSVTYPTSTPPSRTPFLPLNLLPKYCIIGNVSSMLVGIPSSPFFQCTYPTFSNVPFIRFTPSLLTINPFASPRSNTGVPIFGPLTSMHEVGSGPPMEITSPNPISGPRDQAVARPAIPPCPYRQHQDLSGLEAAFCNQDILNHVFGEKSGRFGEACIGFNVPGTGVDEDVIAPVVVSCWHGQREGEGCLQGET
jgi:hypothetical protein